MPGASVLVAEMNIHRGEPSDEQLETQFRAGDESGFEILYRRYRHPLMRYLTRLCGNLVEAQDLMQETFVRVFVSQSRTPRGIFRVWLYKVATNVYRGFLRKRAVRRETHLGEQSEQIIASHKKGQSANDVISRRIREAVQSLPPLHRTTVILLHFQGLSYPEIAQIEGCTVGAIRSRIFHARRMLRDKLRT